MRLAIAVPEEHVSAQVLNAGLEATTRLNESMLDKGEVPTFDEALDAGRVKWKPEPPGDERFDHAATVVRRGWGDCDDLAPWHAASLRASGEDHDARAIVRRSGPAMWHAIVKRGDGTYDDPSRAAGMGAPRLGSARPAVLPTMFPPHNIVGGGSVRPTVACRLNGPIWEARADAPWGDTAYALASLKKAPVASTALVGAILGACVASTAAGIANPEHTEKLMALAAVLDGHHPDDVEDVCGSDAVEHALTIVRGLQRCTGFSFGKIFHALEPLTSKLVSFIPGVGPIASTALDIANKLIPGGPPGPLKIPGVPADVAATITDAAAAIHPSSPPGPPPRPQHLEHLPPHYAAMEVSPGGPVVMRF
jgi:hypothetical protein